MKSNASLITEKLLNKQYVLINLVAFILFFADYILITTIPLYALEIGGTASTAGAFMSVISLTALVLRPVMGNLMDTKTRRLVLAIGAIALGAAAIFYGLVASISVILVLAVIHGLSVSALTTSAPTIVADVTPPSRLAEGISMYGIAMNLTLAAGPVAALFLIDQLHYSLTFGVGFGIIVLGSILIFLINYEKKARKYTEETFKTKEKFNIKNLFEKTALKPSLYLIFISFGLSIIMTFIPIYGESRGVENIGLFFTFYAGATVIISFFTGKLVQKYGVSRIFIPALVLQLVALLILAFAYSLSLMIAAAILYGIGYGASFSIVSIIGMELAPPERRGAANATIYASMDIGIALGSIVLGVVTTKFGFTAAFIITAVMLFIDLIVFSILNKEKPVGDQSDSPLIDTKEVNSGAI